MEKKSRLEPKKANGSASLGVRPPAPFWVVPGVVILGIGFILTSLIQLGALADYGYFRQLFQSYPEGLVRLWYPISWGTHLLGVVAGIGLFRHKEFFRKTGVFLACIAFVEAFGKHSHEGFVQYLNQLSGEMAANRAPFSPESIIQYAQAWNLSWFTESSFAWVCVAVIIVWEICVALGVIFFLTRPSVKSLFR